MMVAEIILRKNILRKMEHKMVVKYGKMDVKLGKIEQI